MADTIPTLREAAQQALEALVHMTGVLNAAGWATGHADAAVKALRAALAEQDAEQASPAYLAEPGAAQATRADLVANWPEHNRARMTVALHYAAPAAEQAEPVAVPAGWALVRTPITEEMHVAAAKVLVRAHGLDGTPQRMLDAMIAAAPPAPARQEPLTDEQIDTTAAEWESSRHSFTHGDGTADVKVEFTARRLRHFARAVRSLPAAPITAAPAEGEKR